MLNRSAGTGGTPAHSASLPSAAAPVRQRVDRQHGRPRVGRRLGGERGAAGHEHGRHAYCQNSSWVHAGLVTVSLIWAGSALTWQGRPPRTGFRCATPVPRLSYVQCSFALICPAHGNTISPQFVGSILSSKTSSLTMPVSWLFQCVRSSGVGAGLVAVRGAEVAAQHQAVGDLQPEGRPAGSRLRPRSACRPPSLTPWPRPAPPRCPSRIP